jgi:hypothetical protein
MNDAHVLPECLLANDDVFPAGTECDKCNNYFAVLDGALVQYPLIAVAIQFHGLAGKHGKREVLGGVRRTPASATTFQLDIKIEQPRMTFGNDGSVHVEGAIKHGPAFDFGRFRRSIHRLAFNFAARYEGAAFVLDHRFDAVRKYIRQPNSALEAWPYVQIEPASKHLPALIQATCDDEGERYLVMARLFQTIFAVDLLNAGGLEEIAARFDGKYVSAGERTPPPAVIRYGATLKPTEKSE